MKTGKLVILGLLMGTHPIAVADEVSPMEAGQGSAEPEFALGARIYRISRNTVGAVYTEVRTLQYAANLGTYYWGEGNKKLNDKGVEELHGLFSPAYEDPEWEDKPVNMLKIFGQAQMGIGAVTLGSASEFTRTGLNVSLRSINGFLGSNVWQYDKINKENATPERVAQALGAHLGMNVSKVVSVTLEMLQGIWQESTMLGDDVLRELAKQFRIETEGDPKWKTKLRNMAGALIESAGDAGKAFAIGADTIVFALPKAIADGRWGQNVLTGETEHVPNFYRPEAPMDLGIRENGFKQAFDPQSESEGDNGEDSPPASQDPVVEEGAEVLQGVRVPQAD